MAAWIPPPSVWKTNAPWANVGDVVKKALAGKKVSDEIALGAHSEFGSASNAVVSALMAMKLKVKS